LFKEVEHVDVRDLYDSMVSAPLDSARPQPVETKANVNSANAARPNVPTPCPDQYVRHPRRLTGSNHRPSGRDSRDCGACAGISSRLNPENRPAGNFLLLGPTGTGKTRTVEALAEVLHGNSRYVLKIDCSEFQMEHEVAKLIGAPPGYLGHRETHPILTQSRLSSITSDKCSASIVLFDEIEKAAPSMARLLLGVLDKGLIRLGDNNTTNFERSLIFFTSNIGARKMNNALTPGFGFVQTCSTAPNLESIASREAKRKFSPEFMNRMDAVITYKPLETSALREILDQQIRDLQMHLVKRLGVKAFTVQVHASAHAFLLRTGTSLEYGAREIKRNVHRQLTQPIAKMVADEQIAPGSIVHAEMRNDRIKLRAA
jgi:ATP-dependent Clp protease ATP-binding subunit ClpA